MRNLQINKHSLDIAISSIATTHVLSTLSRKVLSKLTARDGPGEMSKSEIQSWISSSNNGPDISHEQEFVWQRDNVLGDWDRAMEYAQAQLINERTKTRVQFLQEEMMSLVKHGDMTLAQCMGVFRLLTRTYPRYVDNASREAVEAVLVELVRRDESRGASEDETKFGVTEQVLGWLANEVGRISKRGVSLVTYAAADVFVLLSWSCGIYTTVLRISPTFTSSTLWRVLLVTMGTLFDVIRGSSTQAKPTLQKGALTRTRRALRSAPEQIPVLLGTLVAHAKAAPVPLVCLPLIGVAVDVTLRLKNVKDESLTRLTSETKDEIIGLYISSILMAKAPVPPHTLDALHDFTANFITEEDLNDTILPAMEKSLLRTPEYSLSAISEFISAYPKSLSPLAFRALFTATLNNSKSSNSLTRSGAIALFTHLIKKATSDSELDLAAAELLALPKAGKTAGPEHRTALFAMLHALPPSASASSRISKDLPGLINKEAYDPALTLLAAVLPPHLAFLLRADNSAVPSAELATGMGHTKPLTRRAFVTIVGSVFWEIGELNTGEEERFARAVLPALEGSLKIVAANPSGAAAGALEGYVAVAVLLGPILRSGKFDAAIAGNPVLQSLTTLSVKPLFLFWDRIYQKTNEPSEQMWLLRACDSALVYLKTDLLKNEALRIQLGLCLLHLAVDGASPEVRRAVVKALEVHAAGEPQLVNHLVREALEAWLLREKGKAVPGSEDEDAQFHKQGRLIAFMSSAAAIGEDVDLLVRENLMAKFVVLGHHTAICGHSVQIWIELCQKARADPHKLVTKNVDKLFDTILKASNLDSKLGFGQAGYLAIRTLAFVAPEVALPRAVAQLREDLSPEILDAITETDFGIWATPEGTPFINVLVAKADDTGPKKGKDAEIARWEASVRSSLASKKAAAATTLSKQDQALVNAQLAKETIVRQKVEDVRHNLLRGLQIVRSLVSSNMHEFQSHISAVAALLLDGALKKGSILVGLDAVETYLDLAKCSSERLDTFRQWVGVATLRSMKVESLPQELQAEPLNLLVIRVLYRLRTLSEQAPFDAATFSYAYPLLAGILTQGGVGSEDEDEILEQIALVLDIVKFHCGEFSDSAYPRKQTIEILLHIIRQQPKLTKEASSALVDLGEALHATASREEIDTLVKGTLHQEVYVRNACLQTIQPFDLTDLDWSTELWIASHDDDEQNARLAQHVWEDNGLDVSDTYLDHLLPFLDHANEYVRTSAAASIAEAVQSYPQTISQTLDAKILAPEFDQYGMVIANSLDRSDPWSTRLAISRTFELMAPSVTSSEVDQLFTFFINDEALGDRAPDVRRGMLNAGSAIIDLHGATRLAALIAMFEVHLKGVTPSTETGDHIKEAVVILFGRVARHLDATDPRIPNIVDRLVEALKTPAEQVQIAVSDCLAPLIKLMRSRTPQLVEGLLGELSGAPKYAARRGAAYGLAGVIKGTGIAGMKEFDVLSRLQSYSEDKKHYEPRQGAMFAFETLSNTLGRLFEPYITHILPLLLTCFGDTTSDVREATQDAARVIMGNMSGYGLKLMLPSLLSGLDEKQWRTKKGSIELLGMMAYCSPRQLSLSLPIVIPQLTGVLTDSHAQVRAAANKSLKQFGEVISNPEIKSLVPVLLKALVDPAKTANALASLLKTSFMHYIDQSSLALVIPIIERGLRERGADIKKKAVQIVGNLASLTDSKDFVPYLSKLLPMVHTVLVDPVPEARATAAKALGTLVERLGEIHFPDLVPGLLRTLKTDTSGVDRQGAAQGLSEVLSGLGMERLEGLLPDIIANAQSPRSTVREGFMSLLVYLPATFGTRFQPHLPKIISPILSGLADTEEYVREAAMRAGRMIVSNYSSKAIDLLLPELEQGMFDPGWRIRQSSITLVGELLFKVSGISGKAEIGEDEEVAEPTTADSSRRALVEVLGAERRDRILSALYLARQDAVNVVRTSSIHIWKALVSNTPRTVREILPQLMGQIILLISSSEFEQQETAARTTAEICRKFGERILGELVPIMRAKSTSPDSRIREGVCLTICEMMENTSEAQREDFEDDIITMVRVSLVDDEANVRSAAAKAFDALQEHLGVKAIDQTIPTLLEALRQPGQSSGTALQALKEVMSVRASTVFPVLIPTLIATPMTLFNARALATLVTVAGTALSKRLTVILTALAKVVEEEKDEELLEAVDEALRALFASVDDAEGLNTVMMLLLGWSKNDSPKRRAKACDFFNMFCQESELDSEIYRVDWIRQLISTMDDTQVIVHTAAWSALDTFVKSIPKDEQESLVVALRRTIEGTGSPGHHVPGFCLPKGIAPTVPIIIAGLTTGNNEQREQAAYAIGDLVERTDEAAIKPFVVPFTGPLIRVATQATTYPPAVKTAILSALMTMLEHIPAFVKPFFPQLQRTFVKSASDPASAVVRNKAAQALGVLMRSQPRVDPVVTELIAGARSNDDGIASSLILALANVIKSAHKNVGEKAREACVELAEDAFKSHHDDHYGQSVASLIATLQYFPDLLRPLIEAYLVGGTQLSTLSSQAILAVLSESEESESRESNVFQQIGKLRDVALKVKESAASDKPNIGRPAREARELLKGLGDDDINGIF
ncbi:hypothetical protein HWV62_43100 [Athelia sp. TMB]|nr:hypothetical protein HWV62_43100 [Athelia sp. TMB]